jgi:hypothetical protein
MYAHPQHHYDWRRRRDLYHLLHATDTTGYRAHGWLAVLAADYVLPIFTTQFPDDPLPQQLIAYATRVMRGEVRNRSARLSMLLEDGYTGTGIDCILYDMRDGVVAYNAEYAGEAAYKALLEASGAHDLLDHTDDLVHGRHAQAFDVAADATPATVTDRDLAHLAAFSDTASAAAMAYACAQATFQLDPVRLAEFWEWWVRYAVPEAWRRASHKG